MAFLLVCSFFQLDEFWCVWPASKLDSKRDPTLNSQSHSKMISSQFHLFRVSYTRLGLTSPADGALKSALVLERHFLSGLQFCPKGVLTHLQVASKKSFHTSMFPLLQRLLSFFFFLKWCSHLVLLSDIFRLRRSDRYVSLRDFLTSSLSLHNAARPSLSSRNQHFAFACPLFKVLSQHITKISPCPFWCFLLRGTLHTN